MLNDYQMVEVIKGRVSLAWRGKDCIRGQSLVPLPEALVVF